MEHHTKLKTIKSLLRESFNFYKANWRKLLAVLLPVEATIFVSAVILDFIYETDSNQFIFLGIFLSIVSLVVLTFRSILLMNAPRLVHDIDSGTHHVSPKYWYKKSLKDFLPALWILIIVGFINVAFALATILLSVIIFAIPAIVTGLLIRVGLGEFAIYAYDFIVNDTSTIIVLTTLCVVSVLSSIVFMAHSFFSLYAFVLEGRKGFDAVITSFMLVGQERSKVFWRIVTVCAVSSIPFLVLTFPVYLAIAVESLKALAIEVFILNVPPSVPPASLGLALLRDSSIFVSGLIGSSVFMVLGYHLWKDVRSVSANFEEHHYVTTKRWLRRGVYTGSIVIVLTIIIIIFI
jgi:hypothetical protein